MIRRPPTRIEFKLEDGKEFDQFWREAQANRKFQASNKDDSTSSSTKSGKALSEVIKERVGYQPRQQTAEGVSLR